MHQSTPASPTDPAAPSAPRPSPGCAFTRREFLSATSLAFTSLSFLDLPAVAGPFEPADFEQLVPRDKKLNPDWVAALTQRGQPQTLRGRELDYVGLPIGGIACGQLYLGGDGRLWYWDIFKSTTTTDYDGKVWAGPKYEKPVSPRSTVAQGFALRISDATQTTVRTLDRRGFADVTFRGEYPVGRVTYRDPKLPVQVTLEAFSPFIPLNLDDSSLPATVLDFTLRNTGSSSLKVTLAGWLENAVCQGADASLPLQRRTTVRRAADRVSLVSVAEAPPALTPEPARPDINSAQSRPLTDLTLVPGFGSMTLNLVGTPETTQAAPDVGAPRDADAVPLFDHLAQPASPEAVKPFPQALVGALARNLTLAPGTAATVTFVLTWWFPYYGRVTGEMAAITDITKLRRRYAQRFEHAEAVAGYVMANFARLADETRRWNQTWYDATLPYWFLDRTFIPTDCLATQTLHAFDNGRWWGWEGVDCCPGTCQHVWQYAQAAARLFPALERDGRERVDFGLAWRENGAIDYRGENAREVAHDGFCGTLIRVYREHQMAPDDAFLRRLWPRIRKSLAYILGEDPNADGLLEGKQYNTLDAAWYGPMGWISSLYLATLAAGEAMATEMGEPDFAARCRQVLDAGRVNLVQQLFNGEYFIHRPPDFKHTNTNDGCHIDQVLGQSFAFQVGLPRVVPEPQAQSALHSLWTYSFTPDIGPYREGMKPLLPQGRWYAMPGEGGLLMCTWPKGGAEKAAGGGNPTFIGYFIECMTGFEYQVAAHMIWEGLLTEGLAITRTIHDRYAPARRNPYNEIECSDHYSRAMMSYGVFLAACGFEHHGPQGHLGFAPRLTPAEFRCPFTTAQGWGTYRQERRADTQIAQIELKWGQLRLQSLAFALPANARLQTATLQSGSRTVAARATQSGPRIQLTLESPLTLETQQSVQAILRYG